MFEIWNITLICVLLIYNTDFCFFVFSFSFSVDQSLLCFKTKNFILFLFSFLFNFSFYYVFLFLNLPPVFQSVCLIIFVGFREPYFKMGGSVKDVQSKGELDNVVRSGALVIVHFWASWCEASKHMDQVFAHLSTDFPHAHFLRVRISFSLYVFLYIFPVGFSLFVLFVCFQLSELVYVWLL